MTWRVASSNQFYFPSVLQNERIYIGNGPTRSKKIDAPINSGSSTIYSISENFSSNIQIVQQTSSSNAYMINISPIAWGKSLIGSIIAKQSGSPDVSLRLALERVSDSPVLSFGRALERESQTSTSMSFRFF